MNREQQLDVIERVRGRAELTHLNERTSREHLDGKSDDYVRATYDGVLARIEQVAAREREDAEIRADRAALAAVHEVIMAPDFARANESRLDAAIRKHDAERATQALGGVPVGALVKKPS